SSSKSTTSSIDVSEASKRTLPAVFVESPVFMTHLNCTSGANEFPRKIARHERRPGCPGQFFGVSRTVVVTSREFTRVYPDDDASPVPLPPTRHSLDRTIGATIAPGAMMDH